MTRQKHTNYHMKQDCNLFALSRIKHQLFLTLYEVLIYTHKSGAFYRVAADDYIDPLIRILLFSEFQTIKSSVVTK